ncbi:MAG: hypothetical protein D6800_04185 [Candidatus Zixiibacteriota bacterium]|nr:MAG: hypothetical protein D6800_04185 [candidate division Zixibacteria bacterium]
MVPIGDTTMTELRRYLEYRRQFLARKGMETGALFLNRQGRPLSVRSINRVVNSFGKRAGMHLTPHMLRHSFATHLLENGADLLFIKEVLGHASLSTTQQYTHVTAEKMKETFKQAHPRSGGKQ